MRQITIEEMPVAPKKALGTLLAQYPLEDGEEPRGFRYFMFEEADVLVPGGDPLAGCIVAEPVQSGGPREPALIWPGYEQDFHEDPHPVRWFCSEDADDWEAELGWDLSSLCPGGIGGF